MELQCGATVVKPTPEEEKMLGERYEYVKRYGLVKLVPREIYLTKQFEKHANEIYNFPVDPTDVFVCSFPRTGSTWTHQIAWAILHNRNLDHQYTKEEPYVESPWFELEAFVDVRDLPKSEVIHTEANESIIEACIRHKKPRVFKTHLEFSFHSPDLLKLARIIYVVRHPADTCLSGFHFGKGVKWFGYKKTLDDYVDDFISITLGGTYLDHLKQWWAVKDYPNVCTIYYEEMKNTPYEGIKKLGKFLGVNLSEQQVENVIQYTSVDAMKKRSTIENSPQVRDAYLFKNCTGIIRKGECGSSEKEMSPDLRKRLMRHFKENLGDMELPYDFN